jgi:hypothetical protein
LRATVNRRTLIDVLALQDITPDLLVLSSAMIGVFFGPGLTLASSVPVAFLTVSGRDFWLVTETRAYPSQTRLKMWLHCCGSISWVDSGVVGSSWFGAEDLFFGRTVQIPL